APQMYFLLSLFLIRLCSPLFQIFVMRKSYFVMLALFSCYFVAYKELMPLISQSLAIAGGQEPILHALWGTQFFLVGSILYRTSKLINLKGAFIPLLLLFFSALVMQNKLGVNIVNLIQYLYLLTFFLLFVYFRIELRIFDLVARNTMGI